ncbi:MAG: alpha/beta hydrolase [Rubrivivax sp.]|nr:alpha/beta hydrolase [Pyrinomonadaceae bacterium]
MCLVSLTGIGFGAQPVHAQNLTFQDIQKLPVTPADRRIFYGSDPLQFGELRLPEGKGRHPVAIIIHGGCWYSEYDLKHVAAFAETLTELGIAAWVIEYRRIGDVGGGWPGTFNDVAKGVDFLRTLAKPYRLDLARVIMVGHSAGGQLALWLASRNTSSRGMPAHSVRPLRLRGVVSLAGITDLQKFEPRCGGAAGKLLGGSPSEVPDRYSQTSPIKLLSTLVPQRLIHGARDAIVPVELAREYEAALKKRGGNVKLTVVEEAGHFELIAPESAAWPAVKAAALSLTRRKAPHRAGRYADGKVSR